MDPTKEPTKVESTLETHVICKAKRIPKIKCLKMNYTLRILWTEIEAYPREKPILYIKKITFLSYYYKF